MPVARLGPAMLDLTVGRFLIQCERQMNGVLRNALVAMTLMPGFALAADGSASNVQFEVIVKDLPAALASQEVVIRAHIVTAARMWTDLVDAKPCQIRTLNNYHHLGDERPDVPNDMVLRNDLMTGYHLQWATRYSVTPLDPAILKDCSIQTKR